MFTLKPLRKFLLSLLLISGFAFAATPTLNSLYMPAGNTILGNPKGDITVVEFFDYNCAYCRAMAPKLNKLAMQNHQLRIIFREYPVLSEHSIIAAQAALAAQMQGKYLALHNAMLAATLPISRTEALRLAGQVGLDTTKLAQDMQLPVVQKQIQENLALGQGMNLQGVPSFIVARTNTTSHHAPQAMIGPSIDQLKAMIAKV